jgi:DNA anti-recombination protein RmuC
MTQVTAQTRLRADQIEGLREFVSHIMVEEGDKVLRQIALEDIEQLRRSPVGAIIRLEEKVDHIDKSLNIFREDTKSNISNLREDIDRLRSDMEKGFGTLREDTGKGLSTLREDTGKGLSTLREDMEKGLSNLRGDMEKGFGTLREDMEKGRSNLREEMHALFAEQGQRITFLQRVVFAMFSLLIGLQIAILVKLFL